jgi:hypothetical protein
VQASKVQASNSISIWNNPPSNFSGGVSYLLDDYPASNAYSVRLLTNDYTGALVRIRRDSDNSEKDFYPDGSNVLSMTSEDGAGTSLSTWITTDSGYVTTWYDQEGSVDVTQGSAATQPRVVNAGTLETKGSISCLNFDTTDKLSDATGTSALDSGSSSTVACVTASELSSGFTYYYQTNATSSVNAVRWGALDRRTNKRCLIIYSPGATLNAADMSARIDNQDQRLLIDIVDSSKNMSAFENGNTGGTDSYTGDYTNNELIVGGNHTTAGGDQRMQEFIVWASDQSANRSSIESDINSYYSIW